MAGCGVAGHHVRCQCCVPCEPRRRRRRRGRPVPGPDNPPGDPRAYAEWLNRMRWLKVIRDRYYPTYQVDWGGSLSLTPGRLAGRGSLSSAGAAESITVGAGLAVSGTTLAWSVTFAAGAVPFGDGSVLKVDAGNFFWNSGQVSLAIGTNVVDAGSRCCIVGGDLVLGDVNVAGLLSVYDASSNKRAGLTGTLTTATLVGKTLTFTAGIITGFA